MSALTNTTDYFVEMKFTPVTSVPAPAEGIAYVERFIQPTLEQFQRLLDAGSIVAGGPTLGGMTFAFVLRAESPLQAEEIVMALPGWPRAQTTVTPLGSFAQRAEVGRECLAKLKATLVSATPVTAAGSN